jgi:hypothetical protein
MKKIFYVSFILFFATSLNAQTVIVSGQCITGTVTLNSIGNIDGKPAYESTGTVEGIDGIQIDVYWLTPDNIWVLAFDGQPYFQNPCDITMPPATGGTTCVWSAVEGQTCTGADPLVINGTGTLAVKLTNFVAKATDKEVDLSWQTATEINNKGFEIERSADGIVWNKIGFVNGSLNSSGVKDYHFVDANPLSGNVFYRLVQVDIDNKTSYSAIVSVKFLRSDFYYVTNNPGNGLYKLHVETPDNEKINISVIDMSGKRILNRIYSSPGDKTIDITNYSAGIYLLQIQKGRDLFTEKLIKL